MSEQVLVENQRDLVAALQKRVAQNLEGLGTETRAEDEDRIGDIRILTQSLQAAVDKLMTLEGRWPHSGKERR